MEFSKYHGAGNDFVIIDDRSERFPANDHEYIAALCERHFGVGADGLMLLRNKEGYDFEMVYFNADGRPSSMCGNGGRCLVAFAYKLGLVKQYARFIAVDGKHEAEVLTPELIRLAMNDVEELIPVGNEALLINTGSPHYLVRRKDIMQMNVVQEGRAIRQMPLFAPDGVNVNFLERKDDTILIRTYERGVENETLACGTGVTAAALAMAFWEDMNSPVMLKAVGGNLSVRFDRTENGFKNIWKTGPVQHVFDGVWKP